MTTENKELEWHLKIEKRISDIDKNYSEIILNNKKSRWFEITLIITVIGLSIAFTKLVL